MSFRKLALGSSIVWLVIAAGLAMGQKSRKPTYLITDGSAAPITSASPAKPQKQKVLGTPTAAAPSSGQSAPIDPLQPIEFKPAPMDAYEPEIGLQMVYPQSIPFPQSAPPAPMLMPHNSVAMQVYAIDDDDSSPFQSSPAYYAAPPVVQYPSAAPSTVPTIAPYAQPAYAYPAPPMYSPYAPCPVPCYAAPRPMTKVELLRAALCHLEGAESEEIARQVRVEIATEEKRLLAAELSRKEAELNALKADVERLRVQVDGHAPRVQVKVQVLDVDVARAKEMGIDLPVSVLKCDQAGEACPVRSALNPKSPAQQAPVPPPCFVNSESDLKGFLTQLQDKNAMKVVAETCLTVESGKREVYRCGACSGACKSDRCPADDEARSCCKACRLEVELVSTVLDRSRIRTEIRVRNSEPTIVAGQTTGSAGPLPPAFHVTEMCTGFDTEPGQTYLTSLRRPGCAKSSDATSQTPGVVEIESKAAVDAESTSKECGKETLRVVLVTPRLMDCKDELPTTAACEESECEPKVYECMTADGIRLRMMREPFLKDVQPCQDINMREARFIGIQPQYLDEYHPSGRRELKAEEGSGNAYRWEGGDQERRVLKSTLPYDQRSERAPNAASLPGDDRPLPESHTYGGIGISR